MMTPEPRRADCLDAEQLAVFADGGLTAAERQQIESHLAGCDDCYEALVEVTAINSAIAEPVALVAPAAPARTRARRSILWTGGVLAAAASIILLLNVWSRSRPDALELALASLAEAHREARPALGRLSVDRTWARALPILRSGNTGGTDALDVRSAAQSLKVLAASDHSRRGQQAYGLSLVTSGEYDRAIDAFTNALSQPGSNDAVIRSDLSVAWLEKYRLTGQASDAERALAEADRALSSAPKHLPAAFNRALALEVLGRPEARQAWQNYIDLDPNAAAGWIAEATRRRDGQR